MWGMVLPRFVSGTAWAKSKGIAGCPVYAIPIHALVHHQWGSYWIRHIAAGRETFVAAFREVSEVVLCTTLFQQMRRAGIDIDVLAESLAKQEGQPVDRTGACNLLATKLVAHMLTLQPKNDASVTVLQKQIQELQAQLAGQSESATPSSQAQASKMVPAAPASSPSPSPNPKSQNILDALAKSASASASATEAQEKTLPVSSNPELIDADGSADNAELKTSPLEQKMFHANKAFLNQHWRTMKSDKDVKEWLDSLKLSKTRRAALDKWLDEVRSWHSGLSVDDQAQMDELAIRWGVPVRELGKLRHNTVLKIISIACFMSC